MVTSDILFQFFVVGLPAMVLLFIALAIFIGWWMSLK